jgi:SAM-dependent methyltransferase
MGLFGSKSGGSGSRPETGRVQRHSSGWAQLYKYLKAQESLRILDVGPTSAGNINFVTHLGHSIYMANLVDEAAKPEWAVAPAPQATPASAQDEAEGWNIAGFLKQNLEFSGRHFDVVALWDTIDYLPKPFVQPVVDRLYDVMEPGGQLLAFFHSKMLPEENVFSRYHLTDTEQVDLQRVGAHPMRSTYSNRQVEQLFHKFATHKFFLAKDALREVIVTR